jgi:non-heme chloroperoxidase
MILKGEYRVTGSRRTALAVFEHGDASGPEILFIHGFCQCHLSWQAQVTSATLASFRMVSFDLRGHGDSDKPLSRADYDDDRVWAEDLAAVISGAGLKRPVLVAWSLGGRIVQDYLRSFGADSIAAINFVGAALRFAETSPAAPGPALGGDLATHDAGVRLEATRIFLRSCFGVPPPEDAFATALAYNMMVPAAVRQFIMARAPSAVRTDLLANLPLLITHGTADVIMPPKTARAAAERLPRARLSLYDGVGHAVMAEAPDRFNSELARFRRSLGSGAPQ